MIDWIQYLPLFKGLFEVLLVGLAVMATLFCFMTIRNLFSYSHLIMSWNNGKYGGFPVGSSVLLGISVFIFVAGFVLPSDAETWMLLVYGWSTLCWFTASYLTGKYYINESGIIDDLNNRSRLLQWDRILDFVERERNGRFVTYTIIYVSPSVETDMGEVKRVEIRVPENRAELFRNIIHLKTEKGADERLIPEHRFELPD